MCDLHAQLRELVQMFDRLLDPLTVFAQVEPRLNGLLDLGVVPTLPAAVLGKHIELVGKLRGVEDVARIGLTWLSFGDSADEVVFG